MSHDQSLDGDEIPEEGPVRTTEKVMTDSPGGKVVLSRLFF